MSQQVLDFMHSHPLFSQTRPALVPQVIPMQVPVRSLFLVPNPDRHKKPVPRPTKIPHALAELVTKHLRLWSEERPLLENLNQTFGGERYPPLSGSSLAFGATTRISSSGQSTCLF